MRADNWEQEVEFERLCVMLTGKGSDELTSRLHSAHTQLGGGSKVIHLHAVAELAAQHATVFYVDNDFHEQRYLKLACRLAGLLHESIEWGGTYEDVVAVSDEAVARMVANLTADRRLPRPKRFELLTNQIGLADPAVQIVKLADLQHECFHLLGKSKFNDVLMADIDLWLYEARETLHALGKLQDSQLLAQLTDLRLKMADLGDKWTKQFKQRTKRKK